MITLITGAPGAGKTLYAVQEVIAKAAGEGRACYVDGVPDLVYPHEVAPEGGAWHEWLPDGALLVVDECQRVWRPRPSGSKVPASVEAMETHRHRGVDIVLMTQDPGLLDSNVRRLVGRHIHLRATALGRYLYEWPEAGEISSSRLKTAPVKLRRNLDTSGFGKYKSASLHVKAPRRIATQVYVIGACAVLSVGLGVYLYRSLQSRLAPPAPSVASGSGHSSLGSGLGIRNAAPDDSDRPGATLVDWIPRIQDRPESAPIYDKVVEVKSAPIIVGCVSSATACHCYTDQATRVYLDPGQCRQMVETPRHNPYKAPPAPELAGGPSGPTGQSDPAVDPRLMSPDIVTALR